METKKKILTTCVALATLAFYCANGGENAPFVVQCMTLTGIIAALIIGTRKTAQ